MANLKTKDINLTFEAGWVQLGGSERRDVLLDLFNETDFTVRLYCGAEIQPTDDVPSIPIPPAGNYYITGSSDSKIYVKLDAAAGQSGLVSFVEG